MSSPLPSSARLRSIAVPVEHGGWGLLATPIVMGLAVAPSVAAVWLTLMALGAFLARQPLRIAITDWQRGRTYPRTSLAWRVGLTCAAAAVGALLLAWTRAASPFWIPLSMAAPLAAVQFIYDLRHEGRSFTAEVCGATSLGSVAASMTIAGGWAIDLALALWALLAAQAISAIVYVSAKLRLARGTDASRAPAWIAHVAALLLSVGLAAVNLGPWLGAAAFALLAARAGVGLWPPHGTTRTSVVGFQEVGASFLLVVCLVIGYRLGW